MLTPEKLNALSLALGYKFSNQAPLMTALTHTSFLHEMPSHAYPSSERLEFLGDSVLNLIVAQELYTRHFNLPEGQLSKLRSHAVNEESLASVARHLGLSRYLFLGKGEIKLIEEKDAILADALEAMLGAIYMDAGIETASAAWKRWLLEMKLDLLDPKHLEEFDAKSRLQEFCLKSWQELPTYESKEARPGFHVTLVVHGKPILSTQNISKKKAELWLAKSCLQNQLHLSLQGE
ncbi:MAG: ribonuclease III [Bacteriovoracaceae bacterium]|nr:ribonuclease III [Bacteriovoracaceae bacterium]